MVNYWESNNIINCSYTYCQNFTCKRGMRADNYTCNTAPGGGTLPQTVHSCRKAMCKSGACTEVVTGDKSSCPVTTCGFGVCASVNSSSICTMTSSPSSSACGTRNNGCQKQYCDGQGTCSSTWTNVANGVSCTTVAPYVNGTCSTWTCVNGICTNTSADGRACTSTNPCAITGACSAFSCVANALRPDDNTYNCAPYISTQCNPFYCRSGVCTSVPLSGTACNFTSNTYRVEKRASKESEVCHYNLCSAGVCMSENFTHPDNTSCGSFTTCLRGRCQDGSCRVAPQTGNCGIVFIPLSTTMTLCPLFNLFYLLRLRLCWKDGPLWVPSKFQPLLMVWRNLLAPLTTERILGLERT